MCAIALALAVLLQGGRYFDFDQFPSLGTDEVIDCGTDEIREECRWTADPDMLRKYLKDEDRDIRRDAACELALKGFADGREQLTVDNGEPWTRRVRIADALLKIDAEAGHKLVEPLLQDPCMRVRRSAARLLGVSPREPKFTEAHRSAIRALTSEDGAVRDAATAALMDAPEAALVENRDQTSDLEVRSRLDHVIAAIRNRERLPVELIAGEVRDGVRRMTLGNHTLRAFEYPADRPGSPDCVVEVRADSGDSWRMVRGLNRWCQEAALLAGTSCEFELRDDQECAQYRISVTVRDAERTIIVYGVPLTPGK